MKKLLVVDDETSMRRFFKLTFEHLGYRVIVGESVSEAVRLITNEEYDLLLTDMRLDDGLGLEVLAKSKEMYPDVPVVIMTAYASTETAVEAMKLGACDYLTKPFNVDEVKIVIQNQLKTSDIIKENIQLKKQLKRKRETEFISKSAVMRPILSILDRISLMETTVLITGESGTGKEVVMQIIHNQSKRRNGPFVAINCGALPENLLESELFGYEKGSFTGADSLKTGLFESAKGGTLFLDEIGDLPLHMQVKLLRVLQERTIRRIGGKEEIPIDMRIVAATNRDLHEEVEKGRFREDLFYRINVIPIELPPLRKRTEDIPLLANHFLQKFCSQFGEKDKKLSPEVMDAFFSYSWPGNIRELENTIERMVVLTPGYEITTDQLPPQIHKTIGERLLYEVFIPESGMDLEAHLESQRAAFLEKSLLMCRGVQSKAADLLGISFRSFRYYLSKVKKE